MDVYTTDKTLNYLKLLKEVYDEKIITLKRFKKLLKYFREYHSPFGKPKKYDRYMELYFEGKICIILLKGMYVLDNNNTLKN